MKAHKITFKWYDHNKIKPLQIQSFDRFNQGKLTEGEDPVQFTFSLR
jgi:hypothetical protein